MMRYFASLLLTIITLSPLLAVPLSARAASFDPDYIISDDQLTDYDSLSLKEIRALLEDGFLEDYETEDHNGEVLSAAEIIYNTSREVGINPKFLIVLLQKEQSLITDTDPTDRQLDWATGYAVCDNCSKDDPAIQRWKGFGKQLNSAALQFIEGYMEDVRKYGVTAGKYGPGIEVTVSGETVVPYNAATAGMYAYTPHLHGNELFYTIWTRWFDDEPTGKPVATSKEPMRHVTGTLLKAFDAPEVYLIDHGVKRHIVSWSAFVSRFNPSFIVEVDAEVLENFPDGRDVSLPNYSLVEDGSGTYYLLVDDVLRPFESKTAFKKIGFVEDELVKISDDEVTEFAKGEPITEKTAYPTGKILQLESGLTFVIKDNRRHIVLDKAVLKARYPDLIPEKTTAAVLSQYPEGAPILLPDGYLVKSPAASTVYVVSDGNRLEIPSEEIFFSHGFSFANVITIDDVTLKMHKLGDPLRLITD